MILRGSIFLLLAFTLFSACKEEQKKDEKSLQMEEIMAIHDEVMPKMGTISGLIKELKSNVDTVENEVKYEMAIEELQDAYSSMMEWMQNFGERFDFDEIKNATNLSERKRQWLNEEEEKVKELRNKINTSIENANKLLKSEKY